MEDSIKELFSVIGKYERGTGTKINVEKPEGLWLGSWKQRTDEPFNLDWKNSNVKCLGIWIGNEDTTNENFIEQQSKVKNKLNFWKRAHLSLIGKIKVLNTFILSRLWYRTEFQNIPNDIEHSIHQDISDLIWGKKKHLISEAALKMSLENGGINVTDIQNKVNTQRIKWMFYSILYSLILMILQK